MMALNKGDLLAIEAAVGDEDIGMTRMERAHRRAALAAEACRHVAARHGLRGEIVQNPPRGVRRRHHVVMARAHAAHAMRQMGFSFGHIAVALGVERGAARRMVLRWLDRQAGALDTVSEEQALEVDRLMQDQGMTQIEACAVVGIGVTRYESRKVMMRLGNAEDR